jgi:hypothetical protein
LYEAPPAGYEVVAGSFEKVTEAIPPVTGTPVARIVPVVASLNVTVPPVMGAPLAATWAERVTAWLYTAVVKDGMFRVTCVGCAMTVKTIPLDPVGVAAKS